MKSFNLRFRVVLMALVSVLSLAIASAQDITVRGTVIDHTGEPLLGASIVVKGRPGVGTTTDLDGQFQMKALRSETLVVSFIGYVSQEVALATAHMPLSIRMVEDSKTLGDVVVIGYGSMQKKDLTGSITSISEKNFQKGVISTPSELLVGKVAGVQITPNGSPGAGSTIRIRGGASLNASNDPLIVIDGVPVENTAASGAPSVLSSINPQDIASMNVLKDASATAIYGSRASNGVIIITTKRGTVGQDMQIDFSTSHSLAHASRRVDVLTGDEMRALVKGTAHEALAGTASTDWQDEIYQLAYGTDNNFSVSGAAGIMPYRASLGLYHQEGVLKTDAMQRVSQSFTLNPRFLDGDLNVDANLKLSMTRNRFAEHDAINSAVVFDPTQPVRAPGFDAYGGYFTWLSASGAPHSLAPANPVAMLEQRENKSNVFRSIGSLKIDYRAFFLKDLKFNLNLGFDYTAGSGQVYVPENAAWEWNRSTTPGAGGTHNAYRQRRRNLLLDFYANYNKEIESLSSRIDLMAGYSYQDWKTFAFNMPDRTASGQVISSPIYARDFPQNTLVSYYARLNYNLLDRYLLTATIRTDGSSRFSPENRWGIFPSLALAWRVNNEAFLRNVKWLDDLKVRLGYGVTGQQDGIANYSYMAGYFLSANTHAYQMGNTFYNMYRPAPYDENIKWEQTTTYNVGLDFAILNNRVSGSVDLYRKHTSDLLNVTPIPAGSNFSNEILTNIGNIENEGLEFTINATPVQTKTFSWDLSYNFTFNRSKITKLTANEDPQYLGVDTGDIRGATETKIQIHSVGYQPSTFFVYKQLYTADGQPIEGAYADLNGDGIINKYDRYHYKSGNPDFLMGFSTSLTWGRLSLSTALRASIGNYVYDNVSSSMAYRNEVLDSNGFIKNTPHEIYKSKFVTSQYLSDYYIHNASFLKMDNLSLSYDFGKIGRRVGLRASATVQNVFVLSDYKGIDPERSIDNKVYPMPRTYSLNFAFSL